MQHQGLPFLSSEESDLVVAAFETVGLGADEFLETTAEFLSQGFWKMHLLGGLEQT